MSDENKDKLTGIFDFIGQVASVLTVPLILALAYWMHLEIKSASQEAKIAADSAYVAKTDFQTQVSVLANTDSKLWEKESDLATTLNSSLNGINLKLQHLEDSLPKK